MALCSGVAQVIIQRTRAGKGSSAQVLHTPRKKILICNSSPVVPAGTALLLCIFTPPTPTPPPVVVPAGADGALLPPRGRQVRRWWRRSIVSPQPPPPRLSLRVPLPRLAVLFCRSLPNTHTRTCTEERVVSFFFFSLRSFFSSRSNPEPGPSLPLRCSLAHKHKTAFIILPVAAQGLASKSY